MEAALQAVTRYVKPYVSFSLTNVSESGAKRSRVFQEILVSETAFIAALSELSTVSIPSRELKGL